MDAERNLKEVHRELYKGETIVLFFETTTVPGRERVENISNYVARVVPGNSAIEWQEELRPDVGTALSAIRKLIDQEKR